MRHTAPPRTFLNSRQNLNRGSGYASSGSENGRNPGVLEKLVVLRRDDTAADHHNITSAERSQSGDQLRNEGLVGSSLGADTDYVYVRVDSLLGYLLWCLDGAGEAGGNCGMVFILALDQKLLRNSVRGPPLQHVSRLPSFLQGNNQLAYTQYLKERPDIDVIAEVRKSAGDHLPPSVVPVLSHFRDLN